MKISDSIETTSGLHVFETPEDLIINSQVYDKFSMDPKPYNFFNINTLANKNLLLHQINILEYNMNNPSKEPDYKYYIQDNQDSSIFYCLLEIGNADPNQYFHKIQKVNNNYKLIKSISPDSAYNVGAGIQSKLHYKLIGQTRDYIIIKQVLSGMESGGKYIPWYVGGGYTAPILYHYYKSNSYISINKNDMSVKTCNESTNNRDTSTYLIKEYDNSVLLLDFKNTARIIKYTPGSNTITTLSTLSADYYQDSKCNVAKDKYNDNIYYTILNHSTNNTCNLVKITVNSESSVTVEYKKINGITQNVINDKNSSMICFSLCQITEGYFSVTLHDNQNELHVWQTMSGYYREYGFSSYIGVSTNTQVDFYSSKQIHRHYLIKNNTNQLDKVYMISPTSATQHIYGVLYLNEYTPIIHLTTGVEIYKLNLETETYTKVFEASGTFQTIGLDENNNFYTFDINNKCQIYNLNSCSTLNGRFEYDTYNYNGEDIETNVTIASKNFIGELIASKIHVELSGNCKFRNGKQEATLNTRLDLEYEVPVIITGPGVVYCNINEVE